MCFANIADIDVFTIDADVFFVANQYIIPGDAEWPCAFLLEDFTDIEVDDFVERVFDDFG